MKKDLLKDFVQDVLNENNKHSNANLYSVMTYDHAIEEEVTFNLNHREQYNKLLSFCIENNLTVVRTQTCTLATVVRIELGRD